MNRGHDEGAGGQARIVLPHIRDGSQVQVHPRRAVMHRAQINDGRSDHHSWHRFDGPLHRLAGRFHGLDLIEEVPVRHAPLVTTGVDDLHDPTFP